MEESMTVQCKDTDFDLRIAEFRINGYTVLEDVLPVEMLLSTVSARYFCQCSNM